MHACCPGPQAQHIPLDEYRANLARLVQAVRRDGKGARRVVLITPPPVHNGGRKAWQVVVSVLLSPFPQGL